MGHGDATRVTNAIRQVVGQQTKGGAQIDFALGVVAVTSGNYADIYLNGNTTTASENFRVPAHFYVNVGDTVLVAIDYGSNLGKWVIEVLPTATYSMLAINPNTGEIYTSDGESTPIAGSIGSRAFSFFAG